MISYNLRCSNGHEFEGWFASSSDFEAQRARNLVECPICSVTSVEKALMAPAIATSGATREATPVLMDPEKREALAQLRALVQKVRANAEDVGERFAEEARKIHYGEAEERGIYGRASAGDIRSLAEEGVPIMPLPVLPEDQN